MKQMRFGRAIVGVAAGFLLVFGGLFGVAKAQQQQPGGSGLQITPTRTELSVPPGEVKGFSIIVKNVTKGVVSVKTFLNDFDADGETGEPKLVVDENVPQSASSLKPFLKGMTDFNLNGGQSKEVKLSIDVPNDTGAGGYYGAVRFVALPPGQDEASDERQVALNASVASLVLVEVEGNIIEQVQIDKIEVRRDNEPSSFFTAPPNRLAVDIRNKGNSFAKPFGRVQINGMNGKEVYSYELNGKDPRGNVLPQNSRVFVDDIKGIKSPGRYTAIVNVSYGSGGDVITQKVSFWYIPFWVIAVIVVLLLAIAAYVYFGVIRRRGRSHRRR
jgi:hypothetical protein